MGNGAVVSSVADPVFTLITKDGRCSAGLFDLFAGAIRGDIIDLPALAAHQRAPAVTVLSIFMHVLARYARVEGQSAASWADAWDKLISADALRLTAPDGKVAFLQPPTNEPTSPQSIEAADLMLPNVEHEVKRTWSTHSAETAIFSLMGSLARPNTKDHRSSTRTGICAVLPSADGTIGSEIVALVTAYDRLNLPSNKSTKAQDHFVWLKPYRPADKSMSFADLPLPFLDVGRAQRIVATTNAASKSGHVQTTRCGLLEGTLGLMTPTYPRLPKARAWLDISSRPSHLTIGFNITFCSAILISSARLSGLEFWI